jgi:hypothetical protein
MTATLLNVTPDEYHQLPGFSASIAKTLIERSPLHAWTQHPSFGAKGKKPTKEMDMGTVIHRLVLGKGKSFVVVNCDDWRTSKAKDARDEARAAGLVPVLAKDYDRACEAAKRIVFELKRRGIELNGASEVAIGWTELEDLDCRCMLDHVWLDTGAILDLKITGNAAPGAVERNAENMGYALQAAAYKRAVEQIKPELVGRTRFLFAFCEPEDPFAVNVCEPDGMFREIGELRWNRACREWDGCLKTNHWPAYGAGVNTISAPQWALAREEYQL